MGFFFNVLVFSLLGLSLLGSFVESRRQVQTLSKTKSKLQWFNNTEIGAWHAFHAKVSGLTLPPPTPYAIPSTATTPKKPATALTQAKTLADVDGPIDSPKDKLDAPKLAASNLFSIIPRYFEVYFRSDSGGDCGLAEVNESNIIFKNCLSAAVMLPDPCVNGVIDFEKLKMGIDKDINPLDSSQWKKEQDQMFLKPNEYLESHGVVFCQDSTGDGQCDWEDLNKNGTTEYEEIVPVSIASIGGEMTAFNQQWFGELKPQYGCDVPVGMGEVKKICKENNFNNKSPLLNHPIAGRAFVTSQPILGPEGKEATINPINQDNANDVIGNKKKERALRGMVVKYYDPITKNPSPVAKASGIVFDLDDQGYAEKNPEVLTIQARDINGNIIDSTSAEKGDRENVKAARIVITGGKDAGTGDSSIVFWSFDRPTADIYSISFWLDDYGFAMDSFSPSSICKPKGL